MALKPSTTSKVVGKWVDEVYTLLANGTKVPISTTVQDHLRSITIRTVTGSSRPKPRPLTPSAYHLNWQESGAMHSFFYSTDVGGGAKRIEIGGGPGLGLGSGGYTLIGPTPAGAVDDAYNKALDRLNDSVRGSLDLSVDIAQAGQTAKMLRVTDSIVDYVKRHLRNRNRFTALIKDLADARLAFIYGWKPLAEDLFLAADEAIRVPLNALGRFQGTATVPMSFTGINLNCYFGSYTFPLDSVDCKVSVKIGVQLTTPDFDIARWASLNPVSIAWEALPYSFVVDWMLNIGGYLRNLETGLLYNSRFLNGYVTQTFKGKVTGYSSDGFWRVYGNNVDFDRRLLSSYPLPTLPRFNVEMGSSRLLNAAALLAQFLKR